MHFNLFLPLFAYELKTNTTTKIEKHISCRKFEGKMAEEQLHLSVTIVTNNKEFGGHLQVPVNKLDEFPKLYNLQITNKMLKNI